MIKIILITLLLFLAGCSTNTIENENYNTTCNEDVVILNETSCEIIEEHTTTINNTYVYEKVVKILEDKK